MSTPSLEKRIAAALVGDDVSSTDLAALVAETEAAFSQAEATAEAERTKALDPALSPDARAAREAMQSAEFSRDRLRTVLPRLQARLA
jgi:predicted transcriptional regulator